MDDKSTINKTKLQIKHKKGPTIADPYIIYYLNDYYFITSLLL